METINDFLNHLVSKGKTPSVQYAFFDADANIFDYGTGLKNTKANLQIESETTYNIFSITKTFTALSILQLVKKGKIRLEDLVVDYLPEFSFSKKITVKQLLNHTSGLSNPLPLRWTHLVSEHESFSEKLFIENVYSSHSKVNFNPGEKFHYSNIGYIVLGQLIERVTGQSFEKYVNENIIRVIGLNEYDDLGFHINSQRHATGYNKRRSLTNLALCILIDKSRFMGRKEGTWQPFYNFYLNGVAYGGMIGSSKALTKYAQELLKKDSRLLNDEYKNILFAENIIGGKPTGMALSWFKGNLKGNTYFTHAGGGGGYYTELRIYPALGVGSILMLNRSGMTDDRLLDKVDRFFITEKTKGQENDPTQRHSIFTE